MLNSLRALGAIALTALALVACGPSSSSATGTAASPAAGATSGFEVGDCISPDDQAVFHLVTCPGQYKIEKIINGTGKGRQCPPHANGEIVMDNLGDGKTYCLVNPP